MTVDAILQLSRDITGTTAAQYPNTTLIVWANIVYRGIIRYLSTNRQEDLFLTTKNIDAAVVNSYTLPTDIIRIKQVRILQTPTASNYTPATEIDFSQQPQTIDYWLQNQNSLDPRYQIIKGQLFIAPAFTAATAGTTGNNQIQVDYEQRQIDLVVDGVESTVLINPDFHHVIAFGVKPFILANKIQGSAKQVADMEWQSAVFGMIDQIANLDSSKMVISTPSETPLE